MAILVLPEGRTLALPPESMLIEGQIFNPIRHFQDWRAPEKAYSADADKTAHRAAILTALEGLPEGWPARAAALNAACYRTHGGKGWTADNCIDPVKLCSCYKGERSNECEHGRQHQALDSEA